MSGTTRTDRVRYPGRAIDRAIKNARPVCRNIVGVRNVKNLPGTRDICSEARCAEREIGLEEPAQLLLPKTSLQYIILHDSESEAIPVTQIEGASLRVSEPAGLG